MYGHQLKIDGRKLYLDGAHIFSGSDSDLYNFIDIVESRLKPFKKTVECPCCDYKHTFTDYEEFLRTDVYDICPNCNPECPCEEPACWGCYHDYMSRLGSNIIEGIKMLDGSVEQMCPDCFYEAVRTGQTARSYAIELSLTEEWDSSNGG